MTDLQAKFRELRDALNNRHYERYDEVEIALASVLCRYHAVLIGPPGTAKSMLIEDLTQAFTGARLFKYLLTKFTTPEEIFGPWNLALLKDGRYERITTGKLPEAELAFEDEIFKANAAVLNAQLTAMNERKFDNGTRRDDIPLMTLWGAANEMPEGEELNALFDRFPFRIIVSYIVEPANFINMLQAPERVTLPEIPIEDVRTAQGQVDAVTIPAALYDTIYEIRADLEIDGVVVSDRRFKQSLRALQAIAWLEPDRDQVTDDDFRILEHMLWTQPQEQKRVARVIRKHTNPLEIKVQEVMDATDDIAQRLHHSLVEMRAKNVDPKQALVKQGIDWFANCQTLGKQLTGLSDEAKKLGRPMNRINQARERLLRVMAEIGRNTIGLDGFDLEL
jgi:MoxR-like ATPase